MIYLDNCKNKESDFLFIILVILWSNNMDERKFTLKRATFNNFIDCSDLSAKELAAKLKELLSCDWCVCEEGEHFFSESNVSAIYVDDSEIHVILKKSHKEFTERYTDEE